MSAWTRRANEVAMRMKGAPVDDVHAALINARDQASTEGVMYMGTDEELLQHARVIASGQQMRWQ